MEQSEHKLLMEFTPFFLFGKVRKTGLTRTCQLCSFHSITDVLVKGGIR